MQNSKINSLKSRAMRLGLIVRQDRLTRTVSVTRRGVAGNLYTGSGDPKRLARFLDRFEANAKAAQ